MTELTNEQVQLMQLLSAVLFSGTRENRNKADWEKVCREALAQGVFTTVYPLLEQDIPDGERDRWSRMFYRAMTNNIRVIYEHTELNDLLEQAGIDYVILKGAASAAFYPEPELRAMGDVDCLVREEDFSRVGQLLEAAGFSAEEEDTGKMHVAYRRTSEKSGVSSIWELHRWINGIPEGSAGERIRAYASDLLETSVELETGNGTVRVPDTFHQGMVLLLHTASHLNTVGIGLRHLCDWLVFVNHVSDSDFSEMFEEKWKKAGLWNFAQLLTLCGVHYLGCPPRKWAGEAPEELLAALIGDICKGGNFGRKDPTREQQCKYIVNRDSHTVDGKGALRQALASIHYKARTEYAFVRRVPVLVPLGWVCTLLHYLNLVRRGERRMDNRETLEKAMERKRIYREFRLFVTDENDALSEDRGRGDAETAG